MCSETSSIYRDFKNSKYYEKTEDESSIDWLSDYLSEKQLEELKKQISYLLSLREETVCVNMLEYLTNYLFEV